MSSVQPAVAASGKRRIVGAAIALLALVLFGFAYLSVLSSYHKEGEKQTAAIRDKAAPAPDHVEVVATVISVDPIAENLTVRVDLVPQGALTNDDGASPTEPLTLMVNSSTGKREHTFQKGKLINPVDVVVDLAGQANDYPFDRHAGQLFLAISAPAQTKEAEPADAAARDGEPAMDKRAEAAADEAELVPIVIDFAGSLQGLKMEAAKSERESGAGFSTIDVTITRAATVKFFSVFVMVLLWCLALTVLTMVLIYWLKRRDEFNTLGFYGGMLFAFPLLRNSQPAVPPIGSYCDYLAFFWAEGIVAVSVILLVFVWLFRRPAK